MLRLSVQAIEGPGLGNMLSSLGASALGASARGEAAALSGQLRREWRIVQGAGPYHDWFQGRFL